MRHRCLFVPMAYSDIRIVPSKARYKMQATLKPTLLGCRCRRMWSCGSSTPSGLTTSTARLRSSLRPSTARPPWLLR